MNKDIDRLRGELERFKNIKSNELDFRKIEKWMTKKLDVKPLPDKRGSHKYYNHHLLVSYNGTGNFQAALVSGKKKKTMYRKNFLEYLYPWLKRIIEEYERETPSDR